MPSTSLKRTNSFHDSPEPVGDKPKKSRKIQQETIEEEEDYMDSYSEDEDEDEDEEDDAIERPTVRNSIPEIVDFQNMKINDGGTIARVEVVNFMCHKYLKVDLGPKINFVIGHNGSGKSAILTAITLALGANANATNRGRNLGAFIKEGMSVAHITIHLTNGGHQPYKPDIYPGIIIIERRLNKEGPSPYKLKNSSNRIISTKKEELVAILDHYSILVNNPLTMLTQDMARKFLSDSTAEDKYKLFMQGTQLSQLKADFETVRESLDTSHVTLERKKEGLPILQAKASEAQRRYEELEEARDVTSQIDELNNELVWSQIILKEKAAEKLKRDVQIAERNLDNMKEQYEAQKIKIEDVVKKIEAVNNEWDIHKNVPDPNAEEKRALLEQKVNMEIQNREFKDELTDINEVIKSTKVAKERQEANLKIQTDKLEASTKVKRDEILEEIRVAKDKIEEKVNKGKDFSIEHSELEGQIRETRERRGRVVNESKDIRRKIEEYRNQVNQLESQRGDSMKAYGAQMPAVLDAIRRETRWRKRKPVGPLGATLKLLQPQYADTLEIFFKKTLNAFVVECFEDKHLLFNILRKARMEQTPIMVSEYDLFDYSSGEPDPKYLTVLRALKFEDEWVKRQLIVSNKIEKTLLMEDRAEADDVMLQQPRNIHLCFTSAGHKVGSRSGMQTESLDTYRGAPRFQTDIDSQIKKYKDSTEELQTTYDENEFKIRHISDSLADLEKRQRLCRNSENVIENEIRQLDRYIEEKEDTLKEEDPVDLTLFEEEIREYNEKVQNYVHQFRNISAQRAKVIEDVKDIVKKIRVIEQKEAARESVSQEYRIKVSKLHDLKTKLTDKLDELNSEKQTMKARYESRKTLLAEAENLVRTWIEESQEDYPDRVDTEKEPHEIEMEIKRLQGIASRIEDQVGISAEEVEALTMQTCAAWDEAKMVIKGMEKLSRSLRKMLEKRIVKWETFRGYMSLSAKHYFSYYLHLRGDEGTLRFNHTTKRLDIRVSTGDQYSKGSRQKDSRSLSGGEKSFSQISLLLSLWQSISSPIICLDEFDVFMDAVNRKQTMSMIMNAASDNSSQYILITPQDATGINPGKFVTVHRLADPDRRE